MPCSATQCTAKVDVGGEVDSMLLESSFLFVGLHQVLPRGLRTVSLGICMSTTCHGFGDNVPEHELCLEPY